MDRTATLSTITVILTLIALAYWRIKRVRDVDHCGWVDDGPPPAKLSAGEGCSSGQRPERDTDRTHVTRSSSR